MNVIDAEKIFQHEDHLVDIKFLINSKFLKTSCPCLVTAAKHTQTKE